MAGGKDQEVFFHDLPIGEQFLRLPQKIASDFYKLPGETKETYDSWVKAKQQPKSASERQAYEKLAGITGLMTGGMAAGFSPFIGKDDWSTEGFQDLVNRADFVNSNQERFAGADPRLVKSYTNLGASGLEHVASDVWSQHAGSLTEYQPADISQAGKFNAGNQKTILTVTPEPNASRFQAPEADGLSVGGGASGTNWGNDTFPQTSYADGNRGVKEVKSFNPTSHFSAVDLPPADQRDYMTTGVADYVAKKGETRGWGRDFEGNMHFGKEYVTGRGITTANDIYTWLKRNGHATPVMVSGEGSRNLDKLLDAYKEATGERNRYKALENLASPNPTWGDPDRVIGQMPLLEKISFADATPEQRAAAGVGSFYEPGTRREVRAENLPVRPDQKLSIPQDLIDVDVDRRNLKPSLRATSKRLIGNHATGLATAALLSRPTIEMLEEGNPLGAAGNTALAYSGGELAGRLGNKAVEEATKRGIVSAPAMAVRAGRALSTGGAIEVAAMAERSTPETDWNAQPDSDPRKQHVLKQTPSKAGKMGPDNPFGDRSISEQERISKLSPKRKQVEALPVGNQLLYNAGNELRYAGNALLEGSVPYLNMRLPWSR